MKPWARAWKKRGYAPARNGRGVEVVGGGVAQVATTIYLAIKNMDSMEVVEKRTYGSDFSEKYVPTAEDAVLTDYNQPIDFRFTNRGDAVKISVWRDESKIYCSVTETEEPAAGSEQSEKTAEEPAADEPASEPEKEAAAEPAAATEEE